MAIVRPFSGALDPLSQTTDRELWRRAGAGDKSAFGELFDRHARAIYNFCFRRTADWTAAEDLTSTTFLHAWRRRADVRLSGDSALPWLYGIAANLTRRHHRSARRRAAAFERVFAEPTDSTIADELLDRLEDEQRMRALLLCVARLRDEEQDVLALCIWQQLTYEEAAVALGVPVGTVRSRLSRARAQLRESFTEPSPASGDVEKNNVASGDGGN